MELSVGVPSFASEGNAIPPDRFRRYVRVAEPMYLGIDIHKQYAQVAVVDEAGEIVEEVRVVGPSRTFRCSVSLNLAAFADRHLIAEPERQKVTLDPRARICLS